MTIENPENPLKQYREIYLKDEFFELVASGLKTLESRVGFQSFSNIKEGDHIVFKSGSGKSIKVEITGVRSYQNLEEVLKSEEVSKIDPNLSPEQARKRATAIFSEADIQKYGLVVFEFKIIE